MISMSRLRALVFAFFILVLFYVANRGAYKGYFSDVDLAHLLSARQTSAAQFAAQLVGFRRADMDARPAGQLWYRALDALAPMKYPPYVAALQVLHLLNVWLLWLVLRRLGAPAAGAAAGALLFAFHMACFDAYWKPVFIFDVLAATFALLTLWLYLRGWWLAALAAFLLSLKSKEIAIALPFVLLLYECWLGERRWRRLWPYFAISACFAVQAWWFNLFRDGPYVLYFHLASIWTTFGYYSGNVLLVPWAGLLLVAGALLTEDKRIRFGLASIAILMGPLWFLPGHTASAFLYLPLIGLAVALAFFSERVHVAWLAVFFVLWIPANYQIMRIQRRAALSDAMASRAFVDAARRTAAALPSVSTVLYVDLPPTMQPPTIEASLRLLLHNAALTALPLPAPDAPQPSTAQPIAYLRWEAVRQQVFSALRPPGPTRVSYVTVDRSAAVWPFQDGWFGFEGILRWTQPVAHAVLYHPPDSRQFEVGVHVGELQLKDQNGTSVEVLLDGGSLGTREFRSEGPQTARWSVPAGLPETVQVELRSPPYKPSNGDSRVLGAAVTAFGFVE
jgi:hypothetical protein